jgi:hypothetical protein
LPLPSDIDTSNALRYVIYHALMVVMAKQQLRFRFLFGGEISRIKKYDPELKSFFSGRPSAAIKTGI